MNKVFTILAIMLIGVFLITGCTTPASNTTPASTNATPASTNTKAIKLLDSQPFFTVDIDPSRAAYLSWIKDFEELTGGRYKIEQVYGGVLGSLTQNYDSVLSGKADFGMIIPKDCDRSFPMSEVVTLPFGYASADIRTQAWLNVLRKGYLEKDYPDVKVILMAAGTCTDDLLTVNPINSMADLKGLKLATSGGVAEQEILKAMGAVPVFATPMDVFPMLEKGVVGGLFMSSYGLYMNQYANYVKYCYPQVRFTSICEVWVMNKDTYNRMPNDVKKIIDDLSVKANDKYSMELSEIESKGLDEVMNKFLTTTGKEILWNDADVNALDKICATQWNNWISEKTAKGYPAKEAIDEYYNSLKALGIEKPAIGYTP
jgi:TRAP-type C4-dicarboxylate transport system substrate-binding protein